MSIYSRAGVYYVKLSGTDGKPFRRSTKTTNREEAQEYHDKLKAEIWQARRLGVKIKRTWDEAALKWIEEKQHKKSLQHDIGHLRWLRTYLRGVPLESITRQLVDDIISRNMKTGPRAKDIRVALIKAILRRAQNEWGWIDKVPTLRKYVHGDILRRRFITADDVRRLLPELPPHTRLMMLFALATGLRKSNVCGLRWSQVDFEHKVLRIANDSTKNGEPLTIPLSSEALLVLERVRGDHPVYVFTYRGQQVRNTNTRAWRQALVRAWIKDFKWHDLRHTWASWMRQKGTPTWVLMELAGWKSEAMAKRYAHVSVDHLAPYVDQTGHSLVHLVPE